MRSGNGDEPGAGDVLGGRYEILGELGRGGMATVYRGRDLRLERQVAVKVFRGGYADAVDPRRTAQEMHLLAGVDHPSVVSVLDASDGDGSFGTFLVMELVEGADLGALLKRARGPLDADLVRRVVADIASALDMLHRQGVVHRDVKPGNILVPDAAMERGETPAAKLTDFGIAQMVDGARLTAPESILGTAAYLSPEQVRGSRLRPASDVYSLGLVFLEALTGRRAFPGPAAEAAIARLTRPPALPADASPALAELLSRMTALDPSVRPRAAEVATLLSSDLAGAIMAPDAVHTAVTPVAGIAALAAAPLVLSPDSTAPHAAAWAAAGTAELPAAALAAGSIRPVPPSTVSGDLPAMPGGPHVPSGRLRRRFPALLAVGASAIMAAVAGVAVAASTGIYSPGPGATADGRSVQNGATASAPASSSAAAKPKAPVAPAAVTDDRVVAPSASSSPKATATATPTPTPTVSATASGTPSATPTTTPSATPTGSATPTPSSSGPTSSSSPDPTQSTPAQDPTPSSSAPAGSGNSSGSSSGATSGSTPDSGAPLLAAGG
ncbi:serine/threonine-protein kinase [Amnibacterium sp. CER49]|uniref:serine/threonine-protein kinase n=1 Tax=Amnibacterium sp. CER49 TaxID=3039161 RepID=UPI00244D27DD|nr:serine/threonine-protein kinase [Amnibacterium sp. CER49]MDH2444477.1 serine/threonine-protein kinase [Amnibacterium sp. CER49]